jgi:putative oxidoreductase
MKYKFPFINLSQSLFLLRIAVPFMLIAHAVIRITGGTIGRFANFLEERGFIFGLAIVWLITFAEIVGGILMILGYFTRWIAAIFIAQLTLGIIIIHAAKGWFVGEHGTGGVEYSIVLIVALIVIAAADKK